MKTEEKKVLAKTPLETGNSSFVAKTQEFVMSTYARLPVALVRGAGSYVWDADGKKYLDFFSGLAVNNLGHSHPRIVAAIQKQAATLLHVSNVFHIPSQSAVAEFLVNHSFGDRVFFCNSGAEANEGAIKLARKYSLKKYGKVSGDKNQRYEIVTMHNSFHGRTLATITATGQPKYQKGFEPLMPGFRYATFGDIESLKAAVTDQTCAVLLEPIQGEGGVKIATEDYFKKVRHFCDERGLLLILDEVQTGVGRTGKWFAYEHFGITPDIVTSAKALGSGVPIGAMIAREEVAAVFEPGDHASTFGGNPLSTTAALETLKVIEEEGLLQKATEMGDYLQEKIRQLIQKKPDLVLSVRGLGLMIAIELSVEGKPVAMRCLEKGLLINAVQEKTLRILPPLTVSKAEIDEFIAILQTTLK